jgi:hypothetical protein
MSDKEKIEKALNLLNELIDLAETKDIEYRDHSISEGKGEKAVGESFDVFYLKAVRNFLEGKD